MGITDATGPNIFKAGGAPQEAAERVAIRNHEQPLLCRRHRSPAKTIEPTRHLWNGQVAERLDVAQCLDRKRGYASLPGVFPRGQSRHRWRQDPTRKRLHARLPESHRARVARGGFCAPAEQGAEIVGHRTVNPKRKKQQRHVRRDLAAGQVLKTAGAEDTRTAVHRAAGVRRGCTITWSTTAPAEEARSPGWRETASRSRASSAARPSGDSKQPSTPSGQDYPPPVAFATASSAFCISSSRASSCLRNMRQHPHIDEGKQVQLLAGIFTERLGRLPLHSSH